MTGINEAIKLIEAGTQKYFINNVEFKDVLNEEILRDSTLWANCLMDSIPESIASKIDAFRIIQEDILGKLIFELLEEDKAYCMHKVDNRKNIYSVEAEQSVLGAIFLNYENIKKTYHLVGCFYEKKHEIIHKAMMDFAGSSHPFDCFRIINYLKKQRVLNKAGGESYIMSLFFETPSDANLDKYIEIVAEKSRLRYLIDVSEKIISLAENSENSPEDILNEAEKLLSCQKGLKELSKEALVRLKNHPEVKSYEARYD